jgi:anti-sigma factor RsiW
MSLSWHRVRFWRDHQWAPGHMSQYLDDELAARGRTRMARHTDECPECRGVLHSLRLLLGALHRLSRSHTSNDTPDLASAVRRRLHEPSAR